MYKTWMLCAPLLIYLQKIRGIIICNGVIQLKINEYNQDIFIIQSISLVGIRSNNLLVQQLSFVYGGTGFE